MESSQSSLNRINENFDDGYSHNLVGRLNNSEDEEVMENDESNNVTLQNPNSKEKNNSKIPFSSSLSNIIEDNTEENEEYVEERVENTKNEEEKYIFEKLVNQLRNKDIKIDDDKLKNMYNNFLKFSQAKKFTFERIEKKVYRISRSCQTKHKKIKEIDDNKIKNNYIRRLSTKIKPKKPKKIFRCLHTENGNYICNEIPLVQRNNDEILFFCGNKHSYKKTSSELIELFLKNKLFRDDIYKKSDKKCPIHNELLTDFCFICMKNVCKKCIVSNHSPNSSDPKVGEQHKFKLIIVNIYFNLKKIDNDYNKYIENQTQIRKAINNKILLLANSLDKIDNAEKIKSKNYLKKIISMNIINEISFEIRDFMFYYIQLSMLAECRKLLINKIFKKTPNYEYTNYEIIEKIFRKNVVNLNDKLFKNKKHPYVDCQNYIKLFVKFKNKNSDLNHFPEYLYLGVTTQNGLAIYSFNFYCSEIYQKIRWMYLEKESCEKSKTDKKRVLNLINLDALLSPNSTNTYFLVGLRNGNIAADKAYLLKIYNENNKIEMNIIQSIEKANSFLNSTIFKLNDHHYLLNLNKKFSLWNFDEKEEKIQLMYTIKQEDLHLNNKEPDVHHSIIFLKEEKIFIVILRYSLIFYEIIELEKEFTLKFKKRLECNNELSSFYDNFWITKDKDKKYLMISVGNLNRCKCAKICVVDLSNSEILMNKEFDLRFAICKSIKTFIILDNNLIVCTVEVVFKRKNNKAIYFKHLKPLILMMHYSFNSEEKILKFDLIQKFDNYIHLNCKELICEHFIIVTKNYKKRVFLVLNDGALIPLFTLF